MNLEIQPKYESVSVSCSCGNRFETRSTRCKDIQLDVCSMCHPFYTGKQRVVDTAGRVDSFQKRFGDLKSRKL
ncbi:50S ribosomal protein L31 [Caedibacter taeniospiralis]|uniref:50S ribosomal protein L31 n=1 Tax=Caedibacter taeniospiralis TaxID=28907 RepID=UPI000C26DF54|nr:50S ribosomal protein L31 [Caedibacter taeniospiralis]